jgi:hypothetical protein
MRRNYILFFISIGIIFLLVCFKPMMEGFQDNGEKEPSPHPLAMAQKLLRQAMGPIRKVAKYALDKDSISLRIRQMNKKPIELAREYAQAEADAKAKAKAKA